MKNVSRSYKVGNSVIYAVKNISLTIEKGEMLAIMGPSGSGKSTLLNIIGCVDQATEGEYFLSGKEITKNKLDKLALIRNKTFGFVFQQFALFSEYTALENVEMPLIYRNTLVRGNEKIKSKDVKALAIKYLKNVGMENHQDQRPSQLSGGQQQRVAIARALVGNPEIIIADEPTGALDQKNGEGVMELLSDINQQGRTVIVVTHDNRVADYCKRKISLLDGEIKS